jgi:hypothetical protein
MSLIEIERDPYARKTLVRKSVRNKLLVHSCNWCGQRRLTMFRYAWVPDGRAPEFRHELFCSIGCWRIYHDQ